LKNTNPLSKKYRKNGTFGKKRTITRGKEAGIWLTVLPTFVNGTKLSSHEWQDSLLLAMLQPITTGPAPQWDGCGDNVSINHALKYKYGGLVIL
jgi:hypothetical protein